MNVKKKKLYSYLVCVFINTGQNRFCSFCLTAYIPGVPIFICFVSVNSECNVTGKKGWYRSRKLERKHTKKKNVFRMCVNHKCASYVCKPQKPRMYMVWKKGYKCMC